MTKKKKIIIAIIVCLLVIAGIWIFLVVRANNKWNIANEKQFDVGQTVEYESDFNDKIEHENNSGYTATVKNAYIIDTDKFMKEHNLTDEIFYDGAVKPKKLYCLDVLFTNTSNETGAIDLINLPLICRDLNLQVDSFVFDALYPQLDGSITFKLRLNSEKEMVLPYAQSEDENFEEYDNLDEWQLVLTRYPNRKVVNIKFKQK